MAVLDEKFSFEVVICAVRSLSPGQCQLFHAGFQTAETGPVGRLQPNFKIKPRAILLALTVTEAAARVRELQKGDEVVA
jgi:hypothetical protein